VAGPAAGQRGASEIARTDGDWVVALVNLSGRELFRQGDCNVESGSGCVIVWHSSAPARFEITQTQHKYSVFFPRELVAGLCLSLDSGSAVALDSAHPAVGLFRSVTADIASAADRLDDNGRMASSRVLVELLVACLRPYQPIGRAALQAGLFARVCSHIDRHLADPTLRPARIANDLGVPLRTLQDVFAQRQRTIAASILDLRLARCQAALHRPGPSTITEIAFANGFTNAAHFSRRFHQRYGVTPRDFRDAARAADDAEALEAEAAGTARASPRSSCPTCGSLCGSACRSVTDQPTAGS
jgi:AraC family transcriptional activator of tynA and feaB